MPLATGMSLMMSMLALKAKRKEAKYVIISRIDQKTCLKSIISANLTPIVIELVENGDALETDLDSIWFKIEEIKAENIVCLYSTTSCFAPWNPDKIVEIAKLAKEFEIPHLINNAYGI